VETYSTRIRGRPRKRWIVGIEEDMQIMGDGGESNIKKEQNGRESLRRLKYIVGCNASKRSLPLKKKVAEPN
jgi:hypothetical protein